VFLHIVWVEIPFLVRLPRRLCEAPGKTRDEGRAFFPALGRLVGLVCVCMCIEVKDVQACFAFKTGGENGKAVLLVETVDEQ
jgi:hypothetical protein